MIPNNMVCCRDVPRASPCCVETRKPAARCYATPVFLDPFALLNDHGAMPNSTSASKRMRQGAKRRLRNRVTKKVIKTHIKRTFASLASTDLEKAAGDIKVAFAKIDKAGVRRVLHPNTAVRRKSKLARAYNAAAAKAKQA